jgi:hypothetical protein
VLRRVLGRGRTDGRCAVLVFLCYYSSLCTSLGVFYMRVWIRAGLPTAEEHGAVRRG